MPSFWRHVNRVLKDADLIIEVLDARFIDDTRNAEIEKKIALSGKQILYVINKCDLAVVKDLEQAKKSLKPSVFISSKDHLGTTMLKHKILELSKGEKVVVGVVGYPNVGKSSLINALAGRGKARTSAESGYTKGLQKIRVDAKITLLDTPGVFPDLEKDVAKHGMTGVIDYGKIKNPEVAALQLIQDQKKLILEYYGLVDDEPEEILEALALKLHKLMRGNKPDVEAAARLLLKEWQLGRIKV